MRITIYGTGAFGLAITSILEKDNEVTLWTKLEDERKELETTRQLNKYLNNYKISDNVRVTTNIEESIKNKDLLIIALPSPFITDLLKSMSLYIKDNNILVVSKGLTDENLLISEAINKYLDTDNYAVMQGGTFASDILKKTPIGFTVATNNKNIRNVIYKAFKNNYTKIQYLDDIVGVQLLGILKNIYAIISGILDGLECSQSTKALFLNETLYDFGNIINSLGGNKSSSLSYAGFSDMILTCTSSQSRNYNLGLLIGQNKDYSGYLKNNTIEGFNSLKSLIKMLEENNVHMEMLETLNNIIDKKENASILLDILLKK